MGRPKVCRVTLTVSKNDRKILKLLSFRVNLVSQGMTDEKYLAELLEVEVDENQDELPREAGSRGRVSFDISLLEKTILKLCEKVGLGVTFDIWIGRVLRKKFYERFGNPPVTPCICGCEQEQDFYNGNVGRIYIQGHKVERIRSSPSKEAILDFIKEKGQQTVYNLAHITGKSRDNIATQCSRLEKAGILVRVRTGVYCLNLQE